MAKKIKVAINGFGRIGRQAFKIALEKSELEVVAINDLSSPDALAYLLKYDTNYGIYPHQVDSDDKHVIVDGNKYVVLAEKDPTQLPWATLGVDVVIESTGRFTDSEKAGAHITAGARHVIISAPAKDEGITPTIILGVNAEEEHGQPIISNASCTTNCIAPVIELLHLKFGIEKAMMTTIHSYTAEQNLTDAPPPGLKAGDFRRARAAAENIIPTSTGAAISATQAIPELKGVFHGLAMRVPTPVGSLSDFVILLKKDTTVAEVNQVFIDASNNPLYSRFIDVTSDPIVSSDVVGNPHSAIVDLSLTQVMDGNFLKVVAWYDNEFGYSNRLVEEVILVGS